MRTISQSLLLALVGIVYGCKREQSALVEQRIVMPDSMGVLEISLDTNLRSSGSWIHSSDYSCGRQLVWGFNHTKWPCSIDTNYFTPAPDSLFDFNIRIAPLSIEDCGVVGGTDIVATLQEGLKKAVHEFRQQRSLTGASEIQEAQVVTIKGHAWSVFRVSYHADIYNDIFESNTFCRGRSVGIRWQRFAATAPRFDFNAYCRAQMGTVRLTPPDLPPE